MELKSNMIIEEIGTGSLFLLDEFSATVGQYNAGVVWRAKEILNDITYEKDGYLEFVPTTRRIDSIEDSEKYSFIGIATPKVTWEYDKKATEAKEKELMGKALEKVMSKLSKKEQELLKAHYRGK